MENKEIQNVSDTALWVAYYRAKESERPDALFRDPLAKVLIGDRGKVIAEHMAAQLGKYTEYSVVSRTIIIDEFIDKLIKEGIDTVINLGAGMDTRPYRMNLPAELKWVEVDYPNIVDHKNKLLKDERPKCRLERVAVDLADDSERRNLLARLGGEAKNALVITEGVIIYLTPEQVEALTVDLRSVKTFRYWIAEYFNPQVYRHLKKAVRVRKMQNAPFRFYPPDWLGFFAHLGWIPRDVKYGGEEGTKRGREMPLPWFVKLLSPILPKSLKKKALEMAGYVLFEKTAG